MFFEAPARRQPYRVETDDEGQGEAPNTRASDATQQLQEEGGDVHWPNALEGIMVSEPLRPLPALLWGGVGLTEIAVGACRAACGKAVRQRAIALLPPPLFNLLLFNAIAPTSPSSPLVSVHLLLMQVVISVANLRACPPPSTRRGIDPHCSGSTVVH